jgi:hypothetical protein
MQDCKSCKHLFKRTSKAHKQTSQTLWCILQSVHAYSVSSCCKAVARQPLMVQPVDQFQDSTGSSTRSCQCRPDGKQCNAHAAAHLASLNEVSSSQTSLGFGCCSNCCTPAANPPPPHRPSPQPGARDCRHDFRTCCAKSCSPPDAEAMHLQTSMTCDGAASPAGPRPDSLLCTCLSLPSPPPVSMRRPCACWCVPRQP